MSSMDATGTRRAILGAGLGALLATVASAVGRPAAVRATDPNDVALWTDNSGNGGLTSITTTLSNGLPAFAATGADGPGLSGSSSSNAGVFGISTSSTGLYGISKGSSTSIATPPAKTGIYGTAMVSGGRGGQFSGMAAQIRLQPSTATTHPSSGQTGDLFVDKSHRLWFCKSGTTWVKLA